MHIDEIGSYGLNYVRSKAWFLIRKCGFPRESFDDLQQDMLLDLVERLPKHDPKLSPRNAFITRLIKNKVCDILTKRDSPSREHVRNEVSINTPMRQDGRLAELGDILPGPREGDDSADLEVDLTLALAALPDGLRALWTLRVQGLTWTEIEGQTGVPRPTLYGRWEKVCRHLSRALSEYFEES